MKNILDTPKEGEEEDAIIMGDFSMDDEKQQRSSSFIIGDFTFEEDAPNQENSFGNNRAAYN